MNQKSWSYKDLNHSDFPHQRINCTVKSIIEKYKYISIPSSKSIDMSQFSGFFNEFCIGTDSSDYVAISESITNMIKFSCIYLSEELDNEPKIPMYKYFEESRFLERCYLILCKRTNLYLIENILELITLIFLFRAESEYAATEISMKLVALIFEIIQNPVPPENNIFSTSNNIDIEKVAFKIRILGIDSISNLCYSYSTLSEHLTRNICPNLYEQFIVNSNGSYSELILCLIHFFVLITDFLDKSFLIDELTIYLDSFVKYIDFCPIFCIHGISNCLKLNSLLANKLNCTGFFAKVPLFLFNDEINISKYAFKILAVVMKLGCFSEAQKALSVCIDWSGWCFFCQNNKSPQILYFFCKFFQKYTKKCSKEALIMIGAGILHTLVGITKNSSFGIRLNALKGIINTLFYIKSNQIDDLIKEGFIEILIEFISDVDNKTSVKILDALTQILTVGSTQSIVLRFNSLHVNEQLDEIIEVLLQSSDCSLVKHTEEFCEVFENYKQEMEEWLHN